MTRCAGGIVTILVLAGLAPAAQEPRLLMEELTWRDIESALKSGAGTAVITIGATEQHGPHLPLASDSIAGDAMGLMWRGNWVGRWWRRTSGWASRRTT